METTIKSGKLKDSVYCVYSYDLKTLEGIKSVTGEKQDLPIHDDMVSAFRNLVPHLVLMCEQRKDNAEMKKLVINGVELEDETLKDYEVTGFTIGGKDDSEGVTLTGSRFLSNGKNLNLVSPFIRWDADEEDYKHAGYLAERVSDIRAEIIEYMDGKHGHIAQKSLLDDDAFMGGAEDSHHEDDPNHIDDHAA